MDKGHGRLEERAIWTSTELTGHLTFPPAAQAFRLDRITTDLQNDEVTHETVFGVTSLTPDRTDPARLLQLARGQWSIENRLYWVRDLTYNEDRCRIRKGNGAQTMASLRNLSISILRLAGARFIPMAQRTLARGLNRVLQLLGFMK
ncbi:MAG: ISAs1 family transposase [Thermodesulfobacteriota bacterium]